MLCLKRKINQEVLIGDDIVIRVTEIRDGYVKLAFEAPGNVAIHRREIYAAMQQGGGVRPLSSAGRHVEIPPMPTTELLERRQQAGHQKGPIE